MAATPTGNGQGLDNADAVGAGGLLLGAAVKAIGLVGRLAG